MDAPEKKDHGHRFSVSSPSGVHIGIWSDGKIAADVQAERPGNTIEELVTYDLCLELVAAAYAAPQIDKPAFVAAMAALAARDARIREAALREAAARIAPKNPPDDWTEYASDCNAHAKAILALISKDKADG